MAWNFNCAVAALFGSFKRGILARVAKDVSSRFRPYTNPKVTANTQHANEAFDEMSWDERRALCQSVFGGVLPDGQRMGVFITWDKSGKKWNYQIDGHLIDASGPVNKKHFLFGAAPEQKAIVNSFALR